MLRQGYSSAFKGACFLGVTLFQSFSSAAASPQTRRSFLLTKAVSKPDSSKLKGEDAHFISRFDVGVFDGVGGWRSSGIDVSEFSNALAEGAEEYVSKHHSAGIEDLNLANAISYALISTQKRQVTGSSTACLFSFNSSSKKGSVLNLGDSGAIVFRPMKSITDSSSAGKLQVTFKTEAQCHSFNFPYQLGNVADRHVKSFGNSDNYDFPAAADRTVFELQENDLVLLATDGLFDNMFTSEIEAVISKHFLPWPVTEKSDFKMLESKLEDCVSEIVATAFKLSLDKTRWSPFAVGYGDDLVKQVDENQPHLRSVPKETKLKMLLQKVNFLGGKPDDITVTLSIIVPADLFN